MTPLKCLIWSAWLWLSYWGGKCSEPQSASEHTPPWLPSKTVFKFNISYTPADWSWVCTLQKQSCLNHKYTVTVVSLYILCVFVFFYELFLFGTSPTLHQVCSNRIVW